MAEGDGSGSQETPEDAPADASELESISSQTAYESFLSAASAVDPSLIEECCSDVVLAYANVTRGVESVIGSGAVVVGKLPNVNVVELSMLPRLVQGLAFAALQVQLELRSASFGMLFERAQQVRRKLRKAAEALAEANLLPDADIDEVRLYGPPSVLEDCLELAALFRRNEARITGRSPVVASDIHEAEQLVEKLRTLLGQHSDASDGEGPPCSRSSRCAIGSGRWCASATTCSGGVVCGCTAVRRMSACRRSLSGSRRSASPALLWPGVKPRGPRWSIAGA